MLIGDVYYYTPGGERRTEMDPKVTAHYACAASRDDSDIVEWVCVNGDPTDVRYFRRGRLIQRPAVLDSEG